MDPALANAAARRARARCPLSRVPAQASLRWAAGPARFAARLVDLAAGALARVPRVRAQARKRVFRDLGQIVVDAGIAAGLPVGLEPAADHVDAAIQGDGQLGGVLARVLRACWVRPRFLATAWWIRTSALRVDVRFQRDCDIVLVRRRTGHGLYLRVFAADWATSPASAPRSVSNPSTIYESQRLRAFD